MQETKAQLLQGQIDGVGNKVAAAVQSFLVIVKDVETQLNALKDSLIEAKLITAEQVEDLADKRRGLRLKMPDEPLGEQDICWVTFSLMLNGKEEATEKNIPVRIGAGALAFEKELIGHKIGETVDFEDTYTAPGPFKGKRLKFRVQIHKAKTRRENVIMGGANGDGIGRTETAQAT